MPTQLKKTAKVAVLDIDAFLASVPNNAMVYTNHDDIYTIKQEDLMNSQEIQEYFAYIFGKSTKPLFLAH